MNVTLPDGTVVQGVPDNITKADLAAKLKANGMKVPDAWMGAPAPKGPTLGQDVAAPFQAAASLAMGALAPLGASIENLVTGKTTPADYAAAKAKWQYTPTNPLALRDINAVTAIPRKVLGPAVGFLGNELSKTGLMSPEEGRDAVNTGLMALPGVLGLRAAPEVVPETAAAQRVLQSGAKLTPEQAGAGTMARSLEGIGGSAKLERSLSKSNANWVDQQALRDIGASGVEPEDFAEAREAPLAIYKAARGAGTVQLEPSDFAAIKPSGTLKNDAVQSLLDHYTGMGQIDANDLVTDLQQLRADGRANVRAPYAPAQNGLGRAQLQAAKGLEGALDRHLTGMGDEAPISVQDLQQARTKLAKISDVEDAVRNGHVSPKLVAKLGAKKNLSGGLANIADAYQNFPRSFQDLSAIRNGTPVGYGDLLVGGGADLLRSSGGAGAGLLHLPAAALGIMARPALRGLLASPIYQRALAGRSLVSTSPNLLTQVGAATPFLNQQQPQGLLR